MKTLNYQNAEETITEDLIRRILEDDTDTSNYAAGFGKESNQTLEMVRGIESQVKEEMYMEDPEWFMGKPSFKKIATRKKIIISRIVKKLND